MFKFKSSAKIVETPAQMLKRIETEARAQEVRDNAAIASAKRAAVIATVRAETTRTVTAVRDEDEKLKRSEFHDKVINYTPLFLVNALAIVGQFGELNKVLKAQFDSPILGALTATPAAGALEFITLFVSYHAMLAMRRKDSAAGLVFASVALACLTAFLNYSHFTTELDTPTAAGVIFGLFSFSSPFMWRIKIRSDHRAELHANGEIEGRGLKLGKSMWYLHPVKSFKVTRAAAWTRQTDPSIAVKEWEESARIDTDHAEAEIMNRDLEIQSLRAEIESYRQVLAAPTVTVEQITPPRPALNGHGGNGSNLVSHPKWNDGVAMYSASVDAGSPMKQATLARELNMKNRALASAIMRHVNEGKNSANNGSGDETAQGTEAP